MLGHLTMLCSNTFPHSTWKVKLGSEAVCRPPTWLSPALTAHPLLTGAMTSQQPAQPLCPAIAVIDQNDRRPACCS